MKIYKVWTTIEEIDESIDYYEDIGEPMSVMEFNTLEDAEKFQKTLFWEWGARKEDPEPVLATRHSDNVVIDVTLTEDEAFEEGFEQGKLAQEKKETV